MNNKEKYQKFLKIYQTLGFILLFITIILIAIPTAPYVWYRLNPKAVEKDEEKIAVEVVGNKENIPQPQQPEEDTIPPINPDLPQGYFVVIEDVGINSPITLTKDYKKALTKGTWIVNDFGTPENNNLPIILAAHRFGYSSWGTKKRNLISFYNLPKTGAGTKVKIYWNQREYIYEIYNGNVGTHITDYNADLILYTCKYYNSPERIFRYANRVD